MDRKKPYIDDGSKPKFYKRPRYDYNNNDRE